MNYQLYEEISAFLVNNELEIEKLKAENERLLKCFRELQHDIFVRDNNERWIR